MLGDIISAGAKLIGGYLEGERADKNAERNIQLQKDFAQQGIRWKVEDAKAAGVHPLYAMGANTTSFAPVSVGSTSLGSGLASMGQDVGRAVNAATTQPERQSAYTEMAQKLQLDNMSLQNQLLSSKLAQQRASVNPPIPAIGTATEIATNPKLEPNERLVMNHGEIRAHPGWSPAKVVEDQWGEAAADLYGIPKTLVDLWNHHITTSPDAAANWKLLERQRRARREGYPADRRYKY